MGYRIEDMPESERPREKLEENGADYLTDAELLAIVLRTGSADFNAKQLAGKILSDYSFQQLLNVPREELEKYEGVSTVKSGQMKAAAEIANRMQREERGEISSLEDVKSETADMKMLDQEKLRVFMLNSGNEILGVEEFEGGVSSVNIGLEKIAREAVSAKAGAIVIAHNHPSGEAEATEADREFTLNLKDTMETLGVELLDHVVVGKSVFSFRRDSSVID